MTHKPSSTKILSHSHNKPAQTLMASIKPICKASYHPPFANNSMASPTFCKVLSIKSSNTCKAISVRAGKYPRRRFSCAAVTGGGSTDWRWVTKTISEGNSVRNLFLILFLWYLSKLSTNRKVRDNNRKRIESVDVSVKFSLVCLLCLVVAQEVGLKYVEKVAMYISLAWFGHSLQTSFIRSFSIRAGVEREELSNILSFVIFSLAVVKSVQEIFVGSTIGSIVSVRTLGTVLATVGGGVLTANTVVPEFTKDVFSGYYLKIVQPISIGETIQIGGVESGVESTNKNYFLHEALLRPDQPDHLGVQAWISLPDENGRLEILQKITNKLKESSPAVFLAPDVNLEALAAKTINFTGAELEFVVERAALYLRNRLCMGDLSEQVDEENLLTKDDFLKALNEFKPAFGVSTDVLERCRLHGIMECGAKHDRIYRSTMLLVEEVKVNKESPLVTCLLEGPSGSGKTAMAATVGLKSDFPYVKMISAHNMIGLSEPTKCAQIVKVFEDAYKSPLSMIILDDIERLLEYVPRGPSFSRSITQTLLVLLKRVPPKGKRILVVGTTSDVNFLRSLGIPNAFEVTYHVPALREEDTKKVLEQLNVFSSEDIDSAVEALKAMPLKKLCRVVKGAAQGELGGNAQVKINISHFKDCLQDMVQ